MGSNPGWPTGFVPTAPQWNDEWGSKADDLISTEINSNFMIAQPNTLYYCDPTSGTLLGTLPPTPAVDEFYWLFDSTGQAGTNAISVNGNGHNIMGSSGTVVAIQVNWGNRRMIFNGTLWLFA